LGGKGEDLKKRVFFNRINEQLDKCRLAKRMFSKNIPNTTVAAFLGIGN